MTEERWLPVVGHEGDYEVSDLGRVRSLDRVKIYQHYNQYNSSEILTVHRRHKGRLLKAWLLNGYAMVTLDKQLDFLVHHLVLEAFIALRPKGLYGRHLNDERLDNRPENLAWGTQIDNLKDAFRNGRMIYGERHSSAKLRNEDIPKIRERLKTESTMAVAADYGVSRTALWRLREGRAWRHI